MNVYFYDVIDIGKRIEEWKKKDFPGHLLYGLTAMGKYGLHPVFHMIPFNPYGNRFRLMIYNLKTLLFTKKKYEIIYAVTHRGLEGIIFLRALGLFHKPIVIWHHSAIIKPKGLLRRWVSKLFYRGIDQMFFFSQTLLDASLKTGKLKPENGHVVSWGADLSFYDNLPKVKRKDFFISTGRENRDYITLIKAFSHTVHSCEIYTSISVGDKDYKEILNQAFGNQLPSNVKLHFTDSSLKTMSEKVNEAFAVVICCMDYPYTVGLTTLVEAMALGLPIITTDNPTFPFDVEEKGIGIKVPYGDINAWSKAINHLKEEPDKAKAMGHKGRLLAENIYNSDCLGREVASVLLQYKKGKG